MNVPLILRRHLSTTSKIFSYNILRLETYTKTIILWNHTETALKRPRNCFDENPRVTSI